MVGKKFQTLKVEDVFDVSLFWEWKPLIKYNLVFRVSLVNIAVLVCLMKGGAFRSSFALRSDKLFDGRSFFQWIVHKFRITG